MAASELLSRPGVVEEEGEGSGRGSSPAETETVTGGRGELYEMEVGKEEEGGFMMYSVGGGPLMVVRNSCGGGSGRGVGFLRQFLRRVT